MQAINDANCPTLYVMGDVYTDDLVLQPFLCKIENPNSNVLALEIKPGVSSEDGYTTEILYAEVLENIYRYQSVVIYLEDEIVAKINDIEKLY